MIEVNYNDYKRILEENMRLIPENHKLKEEVERLNNRLKKAIRYIKSNEKEYGSLEDNEKIILDILKGVDKE